MPTKRVRYYTKVLELVADDERFRAGPLADFDLFMNKGWSTALVERERQWMQDEYPRYRRHRDAQDAIRRAMRLEREDGKEEARKAWTAALELTRSAFGDDHPRVATVTNALAALHQSMGRYADSMPLYKRGLAINKRRWAPNIRLWPRA